MIKRVMSMKLPSGILKNFKANLRLLTTYLSVPPKTMKIDSPDFRALFTPELTALTEIFRKYSYELRIAGGAVRDLLMNIRPKDIDFATTATPHQMKRMFEDEAIRMINTKGEDHGTITARINDKQNFEITTLRIDKVTDGRHAEVEFTKDWYLDSNRRDLTVNSMFLDMEKRKISFVGSAENRIREDYLRILRYFRFYGRVAVEPDKHEAEVLTIIRENMDGLQRISGERLWAELCKILQGNYCKEILLRMLDLGIWPYIGFPENPNIEEFKLVVDRSMPLNPQTMTLLSALLRNKEDVLRFRARMKFSNYHRDLALFIVEHRTEKLDLRSFQRLAFITKAKQEDTREWICEVFKYLGQDHLLDKFRSWEIPKFPVTGHLLIDQGHKAGPRMARLIHELKVIWFESEFTMTADELLAKLPPVVEKLKK